ncbi:class I SAM-dependent methyltransferase [Cryobacterium suzukii]|nr:class I SAM-dependent methyltransferase [Cryobacterium suzukii]
MTHTHSAQNFSHHDRPGHGPAPENDSVLPELLDLDAALGAPVLAAALDAAYTALNAAPRSIVDLGAGTGTGSIALATRFPDARVHSLDASVQMLERLAVTAATTGVADRVETHLVDLDGDWPDVVPRGVDLAWAALSLHHVTDPARVLRQVFDVLRPGGVLIVTEFTDVTTYDPADLGTGRDGLGDRVVSALAAHGYPVTAEWMTALTAAGFAPVQRTAAALTASAQTSDGARYLELNLTRNREFLREDLDGDDLAALDAATAALKAGTSYVRVASGRAFWSAVRPDNVDPLAAAATDSTNAIEDKQRETETEARR